MDAFHWAYDRINYWQAQSFGYLLPYDTAERCRHKVEQDFAFVSIKVANTVAEVTTLDTRLSFVDYLSIMGKSKRRLVVP